MNYVEAVAQYGSARAAARALRCCPKTIARHLKKEAQIVRPEPAKDVPIEKLRAQCRERFEYLHRADKAESWAPIHVKDKKPIGLLWFGDPHLDDNGCNWPLLEKHVALCVNTPGLYGANIGDTTNNWAGRLARLYADQDTSRRTAHRLAKWFLVDSGVPWLVWLMGNHDLWGDGAALLRAMNTQAVAMHDWEARFRLCFPGGQEIRVHAAHNFKGYSDWNIGHGPLKASYKSSDADLYACGHLHDWCVQQFEMAGRGRVPTLIRVRGYKWLDHYARQNGYDSSQSGAAIMTIFNPAAKDPAGRIMAFSDIEAGVAVLRVLRGEQAPAKRRPRKASGSRPAPQSRRGGARAAKRNRA